MNERKSQQTLPTPALQLMLKRPRPLKRRQALGLIGGGAGAVLLGACGGDEGGVSATSGGNSGGSCTVAATETAGPFPANGTNTNTGNGGSSANVLTDARAFRLDIRSDLDGTNTQAGIPLTVTLTLLNTNASCAPLAGYYVYLWHANRTGNYSVYNNAMNGGDFSAFTWLRGVAPTNSQGSVTFTTIFPGRYPGRATHMHYQVYPDSSPVANEARLTSQLAFPASVTDSASGPYSNTTLYPNSASNNTPNASDNVFSDGTSTELLTVTGDNTNGYAASITVGVPGL